VGHTLKNWYKWASLESFNIWHNQICLELNLPKMSIDNNGDISDEAIISDKYTTVYKIDNNDYRALVEDVYADNLEVSDNPFPSNYTEQHNP
jgi:hypothetical protein